MRISEEFGRFCKTREGSASGQQGEANERQPAVGEEIDPAIEFALFSSVENNEVDSIFEGLKSCGNGGFEIDLLPQIGAA